MEKIIEIVDLIFTLILIGSLITNIPAVNKFLTLVEISIDQGFETFLSIHPKGSILWVSNFFKKVFFIFLTFLILFFYIVPAFSKEINFEVSRFLFFMMFIFGYLWMASTISFPNKNNLIDIFKSSWYLLAVPFLFGIMDLVFGVNFFERISNEIEFSVNYFNLYIFNNNIANAFILFSIFWYIIMVISILVIWILSLPAYFSLWIILRIIYRYAIFFKKSQEKERILFIIVFLFVINKLIYIFLF